jgi:hypothetical protein
MAPRANRDGRLSATQPLKLGRTARAEAEGEAKR